MRAAGRPGKAIVRIAATAVGITGYPEGEVTVKLGQRTKVVQLKRGKARANFLKVPQGDWRVRATYAGSDTVSSARGADTVTVK